MHVFKNLVGRHLCEKILSIVSKFTIILNAIRSTSVSGGKIYITFKCIAIWEDAGVVNTSKRLPSISWFRVPMFSIQKTIRVSYETQISLASKICIRFMPQVHFLFKLSIESFAIIKKIKKNVVKIWFFFISFINS